VNLTLAAKDECKERREKKEKRTNKQKQQYKKNWLNRFFGQQLNTTSKDYIRKLDCEITCATILYKG